MGKVPGSGVREGAGRGAGHQSPWVVCLEQVEPCGVKQAPQAMRADGMYSV